ncbi:hypothetical protein MAE02_59030 [Microvirga aerophila]|jgi:hypothetical protein|uniref:Uncharacterized protein n=1 Tax=Microvirga aerophila TaxID=670291 RepID=A0A512C2E5_9HYPH|nr:hypothetical protein MAE02_59030 [Microvirga aerophila]
MQEWLVRLQTHLHTDNVAAIGNRPAEFRINAAENWQAVGWNNSLEYQNIWHDVQKFKYLIRRACGSQRSSSW